MRRSEEKSEYGRRIPTADETGSCPVAAIILAAGRGARFGASSDSSKVIAELDGEPIIRRVARQTLAARTRPLVVVVGHAAGAVEAALADLPVHIVVNPDHASGLASSLRAGLAVLPPAVAGAVILLADMPFVTTRTIDRLVDCFETNPGGQDAVVPTVEGRRGNPVLVARRLFEDLARLRGDEGARQLLGRPDRAVAICPVDDAGIEIDIDTRETLQSLEGAP